MKKIDGIGTGEVGEVLLKGIEKQEEGPVMTDCEHCENPNCECKQPLDEEVEALKAFTQELYNAGEPVVITDKDIAMDQSEEFTKEEIEEMESEGSVVEMSEYIGVKIVSAFPMTADLFNEKVRALDWQSDDREGYLVIYDNGYQSWSPRNVFDAAYRRTDALSFGHALEAIKTGHIVQRQGWNGKGMFLGLEKGGPVKNGYVTLDYIYMKTADNKIVPWLASQTDILSSDWVILD